jgi:transposase-like protein
MKRSKFTKAQIAFVLTQAEEGTAVGEVCRKAGISEATYYNWRKKYGGLMKRLRQLSPFGLIVLLELSAFVSLKIPQSNRICLVEDNAYDTLANNLRLRQRLAHGLGSLGRCA